ncbi:hypothetical protein HRbin17_02460 [bacterium HR17]|uniref:Conjugal transfer protein TraF n=1 Tax=Candidatus Fervidibacter japonicus TaxID=2035412 RepID=A0A2H5XFK5_9BACT|nr:hypothetical protein HRbin17_02460 [bacterium HR17]
MWRWVGCSVLVVAWATMGFGQQIGPKALDRSFQRPGARALGMGGAYLLATDDATAVAWNPAALVNVRRFTVPIEVAARAQNFRVQDLRDLADDLKDIRDQIGLNPNPQVVAAAVQEVREFGLRHGAVANGTPATLTGSLAPIVGLTFGAYGVSVSNGTFGQMQIFVDQQNDPDPSDQIPNSAQPNNIYARGGYVALSSLAVAHARPLPMGLSLGVAVRGVRADFQGFAASAGYDPNNLQNVDAQGIPFARVHKTRFTLDVGALWEPPVQPPMMKVRYAAVVRNLVPVKFNLPARDLQGNAVAGFDFAFRLNPEVDAGVLVEWQDRTIGVLELHNLTSSNGGDTTLHVGIEHWLGLRTFALRLGYDDDRPVVGLGINLRAVRIDAAVGFKPRERLAVGVSFRF